MINARVVVGNAPLTLIVQIEQVEEAKLLGVMVTSTLSANLLLNCAIDIINQRLHLLYQLRRHGLGMNCPVKVFLSVVVARFLNALPA